MTKDEMMDLYYNKNPQKNYEEALKRIKGAMQNGEKYIYLPGKINPDGFNWAATEETISKLREDGFDIDVVWNPCEYWSIEWGY